MDPTKDSSPSPHGSSHPSPDGAPLRRPSGASLRSRRRCGPLRHHLGQLAHDGENPRQDCLAMALESFDLGDLSWTESLEDIAGLLARGQGLQAGSRLDELESQHTIPLGAWWQAWACHRQGQLQEAAAGIRRAEALDPGSRAFLCNRGEDSGFPDQLTDPTLAASLWHLRQYLSGSDGGFRAFARAVGS